MDDHKLKLDYATPTVEQVPGIVWQGLAGFFVGLFLSTSTMCACGHLSYIGLPFTLLAALTTGWAAMMKQSLIGRLLNVPLFALGTFLFLTNLLDIGWYGHSPLFK
jgi:hypothetical protein